MVVGFAEKVVAGVGMGVEVEQGHGAVALRHGAQFGQGDFAALLVRFAPFYLQFFA